MLAVVHYLLRRIFQARLDNIEVWQVSCQLRPLAGSWAYVSSKGSAGSIRIYERLADSVTRRAFDLVLVNWLLGETVIIVPLFWGSLLIALCNGIKFDKLWHLTFIKCQS